MLTDMLTITNDTITFKKANTDIVELATDDISLYLNEELTLECTFERFFQLIYLNKDLFNLIFHRVLSGYDIDVFYEDMMQPTTEYRLNDDEVLMLEWVTDLYQDDFTEYVDCFINSTNPNEAHGSIAFLSLADIKHLQLRVSNNIAIFETLNHHSPILKSKKSMTLYEAIKGVLFEISFHGSPSDRNLSGIALFENTATIYERGNTETAAIMTISELLDHLREINTESISSGSDLSDSSKSDNS